MKASIRTLSSDAYNRRRDGQEPVSREIWTREHGRLGVVNRAVSSALQRIAKDPAGYLVNSLSGVGHDFVEVTIYIPLVDDIQKSDRRMDEVREALDDLRNIDELLGPALPTE